MPLGGSDEVEAEDLAVAMAAMVKILLLLLRRIGWRRTDGGG